MTMTAIASSFPTPITILWATQSGRAKACARRSIRLITSNFGIASQSIGGRCTFDEFGADRLLSLGRIPSSSNSSECTRDTIHDGDKSNVKDESDTNQQHQLLILFVSTTGDAEQPSTIQNTWTTLLSKSLSPTTFQNTSFALFALGDRAYGPDAFCAAGRKLAARLVQLGGNPICCLGYGDDGSLNGGVFADLDVWLEGELFPALKKKKMMMVDGDGVVEGSDVGKEALLSVEVLKADDTTKSTSDNAMQEWQDNNYNQHYANYFKDSCPPTAYQYNENLERCDGSKDAHVPLLGRVTENMRLTAEGWMQNTRHLRIQVLSSMEKNTSLNNTVPSAALPYQAGDVAAILPSNPPSLVSRFLAVLPSAIQSIADETIQIQYKEQTIDNSTKHPWPKVCTLRGLLTHCADIQSLPEREDLFALSSYCNLNHEQGKDQQNKLISLSETSGAALYGDYIIREKRNWVDLFYDFDSVRYGEDKGALLVLAHLLELLPSIAPRHFSIASSPSFLMMNPSSNLSQGFEVELCVAVVEGTTPRGRSYSGCCSKYLESIVPCKDSKLSYGNSSWKGSDILRLWIYPGSFSKLPLKPLLRDSGQQSLRNFYQTPMMCVGAGTGIAPLRSLIFEREACRLLQLTQSQPSAEDNVQSVRSEPDSILVFGCRKKAMDYYYGDEWEALTQSKQLLLIPAFSRDQEHKLYVQRALREADEGSLIVKHVLEQKGAVYVAGGSKMARAVKDEIVEGLGAVLEGGERDAKKLLNKMKRTGLFSIEAWS
jgi:sulfite reductase alpha subunit-like flavoprotein